VGGAAIDPMYVRKREKWERYNCADSVAWPLGVSNAIVFEDIPAWQNPEDPVTLVTEDSDVKTLLELPSMDHLLKENEQVTKTEKIISEALAPEVHGELMEIPAYAEVKANKKMEVPSSLSEAENRPLALRDINMIGME